MSYPINPERVSMNAIVDSINFSKTQEDWVNSRTRVGNGMKIFENFCENLLYCVEKFTLIKSR